MNQENDNKDLADQICETADKIFEKAEELARMQGLDWKQLYRERYGVKLP